MATDKKNDGQKIIAVNKLANFEYEILDKIEAGIMLVGTEVKSLREGRCTLKEGYIIEDNGAMYIKNMNISEYKQGNINNHDPKRVRKLLLHKQEIRKLTRMIKEKGITIIPTKIYLKGSIVKMELGIGKGKKLYDKRDTIKQRDIDRDTARQLKNL